MGNRPVGSKAGYVLSMGVFGVLTVYMFAAVVYLSANSIIKVINDDSPEELMSDQAFISIVISLLATFGIWLIASLLFVRDR